MVNMMKFIWMKEFEDHQKKGKIITTELDSIVGNYVFGDNNGSGKNKRN